MKRKVLFLCTGNSCRSQMAEAIVNAQMGDEWEAVSAGTEPTGNVHLNALRALAEIGIDHQGRSRHVDEFRAVPFDLVQPGGSHPPVYARQGLPNPGLGRSRRGSGNPLRANNCWRISAVVY